MRYLLLMALAACTGTKNDSPVGQDSSGDTTDSGTTNTDSGTTTTSGDVNPEVLNVTAASCSTNDSNPDAVEDSWLFTITVDDPQGADTVRSGSMDAKNGGKVIGTVALACRNGTCAASTRSSIDGIKCSMGGAMKVVFTVTDIDNHDSAPYEYQTEANP